MPLPKRKHSQARRDKRRTHWKLVVASLTRCPQCAKPVLPHRVCAHCGYYRGRQIVLVAAKRELVANKLALLDEAGLEAGIVDVDAFALHNAFEVNYPDAMRGVAALINIGNEVTNVNLLQDGIPLLARDISLGTKKIREDLQREHGLSADEADKLVQGFERTDQLDSYVQARAEEIAVGVERAAAFLQTASRDAGNVQKVYCCGGGARIPGLTQTLEDRLRVSVEAANPMQRLRVADDAFEGLNVDEVGPLLMLAVGLALRRPN